MEEVNEIILRQRYLDKGNILLELNNYPEALVEFEKAKRLLKEIDKKTLRSAISNNKFSRIFGEPDKAFIDEDKELHRIKILEVMSWTKARMGNYEESLKDCNELIKFAFLGNLLLQKFFTIRACCYKELGDLALAERSFEIAKINPLLLDQIINEEGDESIGLAAIGYNNLGNRYFKYGKLQEALANYNKATKLDSNYVRAYYNKGVIYTELKDHTSAIEEYSKSINIDKEFSDAYLNRANEYYYINKFKFAMEDYIDCLKYDPNNAIARSMISDVQIDLLTVKERYNLRRKCAENCDVESLLTIAKYNFLHGCTASNINNFPELCYYYGRLQKGEELQKFIDENVAFLLMLPESCKKLAHNLVNIGYKFPYLSEFEIKYLENKYCDSKTFELFDIIMFDENYLPRRIKKFDKTLLDKVNTDFSRDFLLHIYKSFSENEELGDCTDKLFVYDRVNNRIIRKDYEKLGLAEYCIMQPIHSNDFWKLVNEHYGETCANTFIKQLYGNDNLEDYKTSTYYLLSSISIEEVAEDYFNNSLLVDDLKAHIALFWLKKINSQKINLS